MCSCKPKTTKTKVRTFLLLLLLALSPLFISSPSDAATATLYKGKTALGEVPAMDGEGGYVISIADAGALLGLNASVAGEELVLTSGNHRLRIVLNAVAAWHNTQLIPLYGGSYVQNGRWWLDVPSSVSLLQGVVGRRSTDRLRFEEGPPGNGVTVPTPPKKPDPPAVTVLNGGVNDSSESSGNLEEVRGLRWSSSREKIRAVMDCSEGVNPNIKVEPGKVLVTFPGAAENLSGLPSPYENVKVEMTRNARAATFTFSAGGARVEKLILDNPRRIVLDFIFPSQESIQEVAPQEPVRAEVPAVAPGVLGDGREVKKGKLLVVLDPGHGGKDPGAVANGIQEKNINLAIGLQMEKALKARGLDVKMTRRTDVYLTLQERTEIANRADADMFVSIHVNALPPGKNATGFEVYLMAMPTDKDALELAKFENREFVEGRTDSAASDQRTELLLKILGDMQQNNKISESTLAAEALFKAGNAGALPMKRVAQAPFFVLRGAGMPAVLLETGFLTNAKEAKLLAHPGYQKQIADAMTAGICNYLRAN